jgi:hypothetical protein
MPTELKYWIDLLIKAVIGIVISLVSFDYRQVKNSLKELEEHRFLLATEEQVLRVELNGVRERLERIDNKLDRILSK